MKFLKAYTVDMEDFLRETGYLPANAEPEHEKDIKSIPVISWTQAGNWQEVCGTSQEDDYEEYVKTDTKGMILLLLLEACGLFLQACIAFVTCDFPFLSPIILCYTNFTTGSVFGEQVSAMAQSYRNGHSASSIMKSMGNPMFSSMNSFT
ncbi:MAG: hypothetical protein ACYSR1_05320 [Planctomycetota bacterium]